MRVTKEEITKALLDKLWDAYLKRVPYAQIYAGLIKKKGGALVFDHVAFRTINTHVGEQPDGIYGISHIFEALGFQKAGEYTFKKKKINAIHLEHPSGELPRIFISQLEVELLPEWAQNMLKQAVKDTPYLLPNQGIELLNSLGQNGGLTAEAAMIFIEELVDYFRRPWKIPDKDEVLKLNDISQYAAWTLLHGNSVNHFAASVNAQHISDWPDLETTAEGLKAEGVPMKAVVEGEKGSKLQQTATQAVKEEVEVKTVEGIDKLKWTYAYFELTQRNLVKDDVSDEKLFSGFLGGQARHLFDMTETHDN